MMDAYHLKLMSSFCMKSFSLTTCVNLWTSAHAMEEIVFVLCIHTKYNFVQVIFCANRLLVCAFEIVFHEHNINLLL